MTDRSASPTPPPALARLEHLAATTPPLAAPLAQIAATLRTAQGPTLGTDSRVRLLLDVCERLAQVAQYQAGRIEALNAEIAWLRTRPQQAPRAGANGTGQEGIVL